MINAIKDNKTVIFRILSLFLIISFIIVFLPVPCYAIGENVSQQVELINSLGHVGGLLCFSANEKSGIVQKYLRSITTDNEDTAILCFPVLIHNDYGYMMPSKGNNQTYTLCFYGRASVYCRFAGSGGDGIYWSKDINKTSLSFYSSSDSFRYQQTSSGNGYIKYVYANSFNDNTDTFSYLSPITSNNTFTSWAYSDGEAINHVDLGSEFYDPDHFFWVLKSVPYSDRTISYSYSDLFSYLDDTGYVAPSYTNGIGQSIEHRADFPKFPSLIGNTDTYFYLYDYIKNGEQYPSLDFWIDDKDYKDNYALRISSFTQQRESFDPSFTEILSGTVHRANLAQYLTVVSKEQIVSMQSGTFQWELNCTLTDNLFNFATSNVPVRSFHIVLSDYIPLKAMSLYNFQIVDLTKNIVLAETRIHNARYYAKSNTGSGLTSYDYPSRADLIGDIIISGGNAFTFDHFGNTEGITSTEKNSQNVVTNTVGNFDYSPVTGSNPDFSLGDISGSLGSAASSVSGFFQALWGLIPSFVWAVILASVSALIVLRILGR